MGISNLLIRRFSIGRVRAQYRYKTCSSKMKKRSPTTYSALSTIFRHPTLEIKLGILCSYHLSSASVSQFSSIPNKFQKQNNVKLASGFIKIFNRSSLLELSLTIRLWLYRMLKKVSTATMEQLIPNKFFIPQILNSKE